MVVDAGAGFEQDMFEFLAIAKQHGMPRIISVLTHLDTFKDSKRMKRTKKRLKHRLWTEIYDVGIFHVSCIFCLKNVIMVDQHIVVGPEVCLML